MIALTLTATLAPAIGLAQDTRGPNAAHGLAAGGGADYNLADFVLGRGDFDPGSRPTAGAKIDPVLDDLITAFCSDRDAIIIVNDDGLIEDWACD